MKKILITALIGLFVLGISTTAKAVVLVPGSGPVAPTGTTMHIGGTPMATITKPIIYDSILGSVTQNVYLNPIGYLFEYQFTNDPSPQSLNAIWRMTATDYTGFQTDVDAIKLLGTDVMPIWLDRSLVGDSVGFQFFAQAGGAGVVPGTTSALLWIQTDAQYYGSGSAHFIDGGTGDIVLYGPAIPEPATVSLLGMGILGLFGLRRKKS